MAEKMIDKNKLIVVVSIIVVFLFIVLLILLFGPLNRLLFPTQTAPAISLEMIENSEKDPETGLYRILVEATISGDPEPDVVFNRNDGIGELASNTALLFLKADESFELTAIASNKVGTAKAVLEVYPAVEADAEAQTAQEDESVSGLGEEDAEEEETVDSTPSAEEEEVHNQPPAIEAVFMGSDNITDRINRGEPVILPFEEGRYDFNVTANDPEGDFLEFDISASLGRIVDMGRVAADGVAFSWLCPANTEGLIEGPDGQILDYCQ
ncbi:MAG: hypothetical protein U5N58_05020 [Actinomycetota bacterium]|nr:hypothetical protein [Actinomycetota bacterium]